MTGLARILERVKQFKLNIQDYDVFLQICAILIALVHVVLLIILRFAGFIFLSWL